MTTSTFMRPVPLLSSIVFLTWAHAVTAQSTPPTPWPAAEKEKVIAACRAQIWARVESDYSKRRNQPSEQLPQDFRETMGPKAAPLLATCDCFVGKIESEWSFEQFMSERSSINSKLQQIRDSGECALRMPVQPGAGADPPQPGGR